MPLQLLDVIEDGYNFTATVKADAWPAVTFVYRPALPVRVRDYANALNKAETGAEEIKVIASLFGDQVKSWDVLAGKSKPAPVNEASLRRIPDVLLRRMVDVITGYSRGETGSQAEADEKNSASESASS